MSELHERQKMRVNASGCHIVIKHELHTQIISLPCRKANYFSAKYKLLNNKNETSSGGVSFVFRNHWKC